MSACDKNRLRMISLGFYKSFRVLGIVIETLLRNTVQIVNLRKNHHVCQCRLNLQIRLMGNRRMKKLKVFLTKKHAR